MSDQQKRNAAVGVSLRRRMRTIEQLLNQVELLLQSNDPEFECQSTLVGVRNIIQVKESLRAALEAGDKA